MQGSCYVWKLGGRWRQAEGQRVEVGPETEAQFGRDD
jgi:hypothetical protein